MMTIKLIVANVLSSFILEANGKLGDLKIVMDISVRPTNGCPVILKKRN